MSDRWPPAGPFKMFLSVAMERYADHLDPQRLDPPGSKARKWRKRANRLAFGDRSIYRDEG